MKTIISTLGTFALVISISFADELKAEPATNILDLPTEILWQILERNNLIDLISFAKIHPHNRDVVDPLVKRIVSNQTVTLGCPSYSINIGTNSMNYHSDLAQETISQLFEFFGHHITKLSVYYVDGTTDEEQENLNRIISKHGAKWLKEISFNFGSKPFLNYSLFGLEGPFIQVEKVKMFGGISRSKLNLNKVFPVVRSLHVPMIIVPEGLEQHFPYLERLTVPEEWGSHRANFPSFKQTLELNPQLKHLRIPHCDWDVLTLLSKARPDLESLEISELNFYHLKYVTESIRFNNMTVLKIFTRGGIIDNSQLHLEFGNLEEIEFHYNFLIDPWMELLMQNQKLKKITSNKMSSDNLLRMVNGLPNLEEYTMKHDKLEPPIGFHDIVDFLRNAHQLKKVSFPGLYDRYDQVAPQVEDSWIRLQGLDFVRRSLD